MLMYTETQCISISTISYICKGKSISFRILVGKFNKKRRMAAAAPPPPGIESA